MVASQTPYRPWPAPPHPKRRRFPGLRASDAPRRLLLSPRQAIRLELAAGDLLQVPGESEGPPVRISAFDGSGHCALAHLDLKGDAPLNLADFSATELVGWIEAQGGKVEAGPNAATLREGGEETVLKAKAACTVWLIRAVSGEHVVNGGGGGTLLVTHTSAARNSPWLPDPLGAVREEFTIPRGTGKAYELRRGEYVQIIDVEGQQCSDFMAFRIAGLDTGEEHLIDSTVTRSIVGGAYPAPGLFDKFYDAEMRPMLNVVQDTVGRHDTFALACTARGYEERGFPGHVNCSDNISTALAPYGIRRRSAWPAINFFFSSWIERGDNTLRVEESWSQSGDYVALRAMDDLVCVSTACPDDIDPINGWNPTDVHVRIYHPETPLRRSVAYREKEDAPVLLSEESAFHPRLSALTTQFAPARDLWAPLSFPAVGTVGEYW
ncbi:MAG: urea carboxylase-associated family protein, partial [Pseudomonadota bacterium]